MSSDEEALYWYGSVVGSLMFAAVMTRPDIAYALSIVSRYSRSPSQQHIKAVNRAMKYIKGSIDLSIVYSRDGSFQSFCDSDHNSYTPDM